MPVDENVWPLCAYCHTRPCSTRCKEQQYPMRGVIPKARREEQTIENMVRSHREALKEDGDHTSNMQPRRAWPKGQRSRGE